MNFTVDRPDAGYGNALAYTAGGAANVPLSVFSCPSDTTNSNDRAVGGPYGGQWATACYAYNLVLFGSGGAVTGLNKSCQYTIGTIPDGSSNTLGLGEQIACYPASFGTSGFSGEEAYNVWAWPAVGTAGLAGGATYGPYSPDPAYCPGGALLRVEFPATAVRQPQLDQHHDLLERSPRHHQRGHDGRQRSGDQDHHLADHLERRPVAERRGDHQRGFVLIITWLAAYRQRPRQNRLHSGHRTSRGKAWSIEACRARLP